MGKNTINFPHMFFPFDQLDFFLQWEIDELGQVSEVPVKQLSLKQLPFKKANSKTANSKSANSKTATL